MIEVEMEDSQVTSQRLLLVEGHPKVAGLFQIYFSPIQVQNGKTCLFWQDN